MKQLKILNIKLLRIRSTKKKGGFSLPLPPILKDYSILLANQKFFFKKYLIVHVKIEIIKKPQFKHMVYI